MSRRAAIVEDDFDDDTDLALPSRPLPNTGTRGPLLEAIGPEDDGDDSDGEDSDDAPDLIPGSASRQQQQTQHAENVNVVTDITPYKKCVLNRCVAGCYADQRHYTFAGSNHCILRPVPNMISLS